MALKKFTYRGKTIEELKELDIKEFMKLVPSRTRRALLHGVSDAQKALLVKIDLALKGVRKKPVKTHCRDMIVLPKMVGLTIQIHNGKEFSPVLIEPEMLGMRLGEFSMTRRKVEHSAPGLGATKSSGAVSAR